MKKIALKMIAVLFITIFFNGCVAKETKYVKQKIPKLRTCVVKKKKISYIKKDGLYSYTGSSHRELKRQCYKKDVCLELLNKQNKDFNKRYVE